MTLDFRLINFVCRMEFGQVCEEGAEQFYGDVLNILRFITFEACGWV